MSLTIKIDGALIPYQSVRLTGNGEGVQGLPSSAWYCEPMTAGVQIEDPTGALDLVGWHVFTVDEPACTSAPRIFTGWITGRIVERGKYRNGAGRIWVCDIIDQNALFSLEVFRASSAKRPEETDIERIDWVIDSAPMAGTPVTRTSRTNTTDNPVNFGDADYVTQYPVDLILSVAGTSGKNAFAYWDEAEQAIGFHYDLVTANPSSTLAVSNVASDVDSSTTFAPFIDASLERSPEDIYTGLLFGYRGAYAYGRRQDTIDALSPSLLSPVNFLRDKVYRTDRVGRLETANALIVSMLERFAQENDVLRFTVQLPATHVNLIHAGMKLNVRFSHLPDYETQTAVAVVRRDVIPTAGHDSLYDVHLECTNATNPIGPAGGPPGVFPHQPAECNPSVLQSNQGSSLGVNVSATFDDDLTPGNIVVCYIALRGTGAIITPTDFTQIETQQFDDDGQSFSMYYKEVEIGDSATVLSGPGNPSSALRMYIAEVTGVDVVLGDSLATSDDTFWGPDWTQDLGTVDTTPGGIIFGGSIIGINPVGTITATPQDGGVTLFQSTSGNHGPGKWFGYKLSDATDPDGIEIAWDESGSDPAAHGQAGILAFFACGTEGSSCPDAGQWVRDEFVAEGDGTTTTFSTRCPYADGSLNARVDGHPILAGLTETDPTTGEFTLDFAPLGAQGDAAAEQLYVSYQGR